jgi:hypothetical protein
MNGLAKMVAVLMLGSAVALAAETPVIEAVQAAKDVTLETDPASPFWNEAPHLHGQRHVQ